MSEWRGPTGTTRKLGHYDSQKLRARLMTLTETDAPRLLGDGPAQFSTSLALDLTPRVIWDTNGFYRALGLRPDASRADIRRAYIDHEGWRSVRLTKIVKLLLDRTLRRAYDRTPLGSFWADDDRLMVRIDSDDDDLQVVVHDTHWAVYAWGITDPEVDHAVLNELRNRLAKSWWDDGLIEYLAVGMCASTMDAQVKVVGQIPVMFLPKPLARIPDSG